MKEALFVGLAGALGAICRVGIGEIYDGSPLGTLLVNLFGTFILCLLSAGIIQQLATNQQVQTAVTTGFLGSFTTFSAFSMETVNFLQNGQIMLATLYFIGSVFGGLVVGLLGFRIGRRLVKT